MYHIYIYIMYYPNSGTFIGLIGARPGLFFSTPGWFPVTSLFTHVWTLCIVGPLRHEPSCQPTNLIPLSPLWPCHQTTIARDPQPFVLSLLGDSVLSAPEICFIHHLFIIYSLISSIHQTTQYRYQSVSVTASPSIF